MEMDAKRETVALMLAQKRKAPEIASAIGMSVETVYNWQREDAVIKRKEEHLREFREKIERHQDEFVESIFGITGQAITTLKDIITNRGMARCPNRKCNHAFVVLCPECGTPVDYTQGSREQVAACKTATDAAVSLIRAQGGADDTPAGFPKLSVTINEGKK